MIGRRLRQYVVTARLGQGGMGEVWLARDTTLEREVALKILPSGDGDATIRKERFFREARAASALNHPNIITIYEINSDQGIDFIAMEYVAGRTLAGLLQQGPIAIDLAHRFATQIAEAVGRAHRAGIVHRDLKPGNIMVTNDGLLKVLDFGLAKVAQPTDSQAGTDAVTQAALTRVGTTVGTLGYMSPEQALGDLVDARSDVFSFGVILYEMLAGRLPFAGQTLSEMLRALHFAEPPPLEALRADVPQALRAVVTMALAKKPPDRFANMSEVAIALAGGAPADVPTVAKSSPAAPVFQSAASIRRPAIAGLVIVVIAALAGVAMWRASGNHAQASSAPSAVVAEPVGVYELTQAAAALLARPDREGNADAAIARLERALVQDPKSAIAYAHLASAYLRKQQMTPDPQWMKLARENAQLAIDLNADLAAGRSAMGFVHLQASERKQADAEFRRAIELDPLNPLPLIGLGLNFVAQGQDASAEAAFRKAIKVGPQEWRTHGEFAQFYFQRARYTEAVAHWEESLKLTPDNIVVLRNLGAAYFVAGRPDEAASILQRALEVRPAAPIYTNLGTIRFFQGRYTDAVAAFEKAVELTASNHLFWGNLGDGYRWAPGRRQDAPAAYRRALELIEQQISKQDGDANLESRRAVYLVKLGERDTAVATIERVVNQPNLTAQILYRVTTVFELAGLRERALASLERALKAGYAVKDLATEPEFTALRNDARYHRLVDAMARREPGIKR
jgi:tetratricopeptide (TPR) repeat protein/predicted Ser/Thr protein kinase